MAWYHKWLPFQKRNDLPDAAVQYLDVYQQPSSGLHWTKCRWVVVDTETTGFGHEKAILSIGAIAINKGSIDIADSFEITLLYEGKASTETISVHGIMPANSQGGIPTVEAAAGWLSYVKDAILIAHNASYDIGMLNALCRQELGINMKNKYLDTADLAVRLEQYGVDPSHIKRSDFTLDKLCERYNINIADRHTAAGDAMLTAQLFLKLMLSAEHRGLKKIGDLKLKKRA